MILSSAPRGSPLSAEGAERRESRLPVCVRSVLIRTMSGMRIGGRRFRRRRRLTFGLHFLAAAHLALGILVAAAVGHIVTFMALMAFMTGALAVRKIGRASCRARGGQYV